MMRSRGMCLGVLAVALTAIGAGKPSTYVVESARQIPVADQVDVLVVGGTTASVSAAAEAARSGARVCLVGGAPYLGEDMAGTLELDSDATPRASALEKRLRASVSGEIHYSYENAENFKFVGGWQFANDAHEKFSTAACPISPWDSVLYLEPASVSCTLDRQAEVDSVEVTVLENDDPSVEAVLAVDHRGALTGGQKGPLTGSVRMTYLDGPKAGESVVLQRAHRTDPLEGRAVREGEPMAGGDDVLNRPNLHQHASYFVAKCGISFRRVRIEIAAADGASCHLVSRIRFKLADPSTVAHNPTPLKVKQTFDRVLVEAGVRFLTGSPVTDVLEDSDGSISGAVFANRNGRQAIIAKSIIDGTRLSTLASEGRPFAGRENTRGRFSFASAYPPAAPGQQPRVNRRTLELAIGDGSYRSYARAECEARERIWDDRVVDVADRLRADFPPTVKMRRFLRAVPDAGILGERIAAGVSAGREAAAEAKGRSAPQGVRVASRTSEGDVTSGDVRELLQGLRPYANPTNRTIPSSARRVPCWGDFDVVVAGGGTSGAAAGIAAARSGARTLILEYLHVLGGVGTDGMILGYYGGNLCGFSEEFTAAVNAQPAQNRYFQRAETWRRMCRDAGAEVWYGAFVAGAVVRDGRVTGVVVVTPFGRGVVTCRCVVDGTGNSDVAAAAGAETRFILSSELAIQSAGQSPHRLVGGVNSDFGLVNDTDALDLWLFGLRSRAGAPDAWDLQQMVNSRERRRIVSDQTVMGWDVVRGRRYSDVIVRAKSKQDSHGYLSDAYGAVAERDGLLAPIVNVPLRTMLPRGLSGIAVIGLGKGVSRDVVPFTRMQVDLMNEGYAVGLCAAEASRLAEGDFRRIDIRKVQRRLIEKGNLPEEVLEWTDVPDEPTEAEIAEAVKTIPDGFRGSGVVMAAPSRAVPFLRMAFGKAKTLQSRLAYAELLGLCGDASGAWVLAEILSGARSVGKMPEKRSYGKGLTQIGIALALGRTKSAVAVPVLETLIRRITADSSVGEVRMATLAAEAHGSPELAPALTALLRMPGVGGWSRKTVSELRPLGGYFISGESDRCLKELAISRALIACGDKEGLAEKTLRAYADDPRGVFAEHASRVLDRFCRERNAGSSRTVNFNALERP